MALCHGVLSFGMRLSNRRSYIPFTACCNLLTELFSFATVLPTSGPVVFRARRSCGLRFCGGFAERSAIRDGERP